MNIRSARTAAAIVAIATAAAVLSLRAAGPNSELATARWTARWIAPAGAARFEYGVYHLRRTIALPAKPASLMDHVSADNRYELFVNGRRLSTGPARGDLF